LTKLEEIKIIIETFEEFLREYKALLEELLRVFEKSRRRETVTHHNHQLI